MAKSGEAGPGWPTFIEEKPVGYYDEKPCSFMQRLPYQCETGGVSPMWLEGREAYMTERMRGMTPERRAYRKQFLADQVLSDREPVYVPQLEHELYNPIRRAWRYPFKKYYEFLEPYVGSDIAKFCKRGLRNYFALTCMIYGGTWLGLYYIDNWQFVKRTNVLRSKPVIFPGDPGYPYVSTRHVPDDHYDLGFKQSPFYKSEEEIRKLAVAEQKAKELRESRMKKKDYVE